MGLKSWVFEEEKIELRRRGIMKIDGADEKVMTAFTVIVEESIVCSFVVLLL